MLAERVRPGLEVLLARRLDLLRGQRVGLITNPTGVTPELEGAAEALLRRGVKVTALFAPEHGLQASAPDGAAVASGRDRRTGLPVYSLYGETLQPTAQMLREVDVLLFDIQDVGVRFYTYVWTMSYAMEAAAATGMPFIVLDHPNPLGGQIVEGPSLEPACASFVGRAAIPLRHGLTVGELARLFNEHPGIAGARASDSFLRTPIGAELTVIPMEGWRREMWYDATGLPWVPPSPAMPTPETATLYPGTCLLEGTNLSEGRGTALPFQQIGAPWVDGYALADALNALNLPGVRFRPVRFQPTASKWAGQECEGVHLHVTDRQALRPVTAGLQLIAAVRALHPDRFAWREPEAEEGRWHFDLLMGTDKVRRQLETGVPVEAIVAGWEAERADFETQRERVSLYR
ncbi:MAG: DUF1343 domain-containing protein [Anaerolineae bacterium]|nr:DUF1343 domain-containing protein [Anaerolineae bacterium]